MNSTSPATASPKASPGTFVASLADALTLGPPPAGNLAIPVFAHGTLEVELYTPVGVDPQAPHTRDELYVVARGRAVFVDAHARRPVEAGAMIFVAAGAPHRFEEIGAGFAVWVAFYGPRGGEAGPGADRASAASASPVSEQSSHSPVTSAPSDR